MIYTYKPNGKENKWIRENLGLGWKGEILMMNNWPGRADPNANEDTYGDYNMETGEWIGEEPFADLDMDLDDEEENTQRAVGMRTFAYIFNINS